MIWSTISNSCPTDRMQGEGEINAQLRLREGTIVDASIIE